ncbi:D-amino-acid transaminase [Salirhabdus salicampi]|uniref:D-amino-acid transaminase n=1 Tax=Salirhabdus salicampi TaxID=476102 RepID=UPI0020C4E458|nr:D-amino-acid transaminase [Salirhabdus salicampi]MCP8615556.1 D-amino-acid transaminase [Salirhabdus salicampi]
MFVLKNDQFIRRNEATIDIEDRGHQFGDGVYEVFRLYNGNIFMLSEHLDRLVYSLTELKIPYDISKKALKNQLHELINKNGVKDGGIYLQITRGVAPRSHPFPQDVHPQLIAYTIPVSRPTEAQENGVNTTLVEDLRWGRCDIKSLNLLWNIMAKQQAKEHGYFESILYRSEQHITEGSSSNFFGVKEGVVITHPANRFILNGITRIAIKQICSELHIPFKEQILTLNDLQQLDEAFLSSTTLEVVPVTSIDDIQVNGGAIGDITKQILEQFILKTKS